jgi:hypothetical protein
MQTVEYRDTNGYIMPPSCRPVYANGGRQFRGTTDLRVANYILCPEIGHLRHICKCEACELFAGHVKFHGVKCKSKTKRELSPIYKKVTKYETVFN